MKSSFNGNVVLKKMPVNRDPSYYEFQPYISQSERNKTIHQNAVKSMPSSVNLRGSKSESEGLHFNTPRKPKPVQNLQPKLSVTNLELHLNASPTEKTFPDQLTSSFKTFSQKPRKMQSTYIASKSKIPGFKATKATLSRGEAETYTDQERFAMYMKDEMAKLQPKISLNESFNEHENFESEPNYKSFKKLSKACNKPLSALSDDYEEITGKKISEQLPKIAEKLNQHAQSLIKNRKDRSSQNYDINELALSLFSKSETPKKSGPRPICTNSEVKSRKLKEIGEKNEKFAATLNTLNNRLSYLREKYAKIPKTGNVRNCEPEISQRKLFESKRSNKYKSIDDIGKNESKDLTLNLNDIDSLIVNLQEQEKDLDSMLEKNKELDELIAKNRLGKLQSYNWENRHLENVSSKTSLDDQVNRYFVQDNNVITTSGFVISPIYNENSQPPDDSGSTISQNYNEINNLQDFFEQQKPNISLFSGNYKSLHDTYTIEKEALNPSKSKAPPKSPPEVAKPEKIDQFTTVDQGIQADVQLEPLTNIQSCLKSNYKDLYSQLMKSQYLQADLNLIANPQTNNQFNDQIANVLKASTKELKEELTETSIRLNEDIKNLELMTLFVKNENELSLEKKDNLKEGCQLKKTLSKISEGSDVTRSTSLIELENEIEDVLHSPCVSEVAINDEICHEYDSILRRLEDDITKYKSSKFRVVLPDLKKQQGGDDGTMNINISSKDLKQFSEVLKNPSLIKRPKSKKKTFTFDGCYSQVLDAKPLGDINIDTDFKMISASTKNQAEDEEKFLPTKVYRKVANDIKRMCRKSSEMKVRPSNNLEHKKFPSLESTTPMIHLGHLRSPQIKHRNVLSDALKKKLPTLRLVPLVDMQHLRNDTKILNQIENFDLCKKAIIKPETEEAEIEQQRFSLQQSSQVSFQNLIDRY